MNKLSIILGILLVIAVGVAGYFWFQTQQNPGQALGPYTPAVTEPPIPDVKPEEETVNWKTYNLYRATIKLPSDFTVKKSEVEFPPKGLWAIHFEAVSPDYVLETEPLGIAGGNIKGMSFFLDAQDYVKASKQNPDAGVPTSIGDDLLFDELNSCTIVAITSNEFVLCYFTGRNIFNGGTWWAKTYKEPYAYEFSLNSQTSDKESSQALLRKIISSFKYTNN